MAKEVELIDTVSWERFLDDTTLVRKEGNLVAGDPSDNAKCYLKPGVLAVATEFLAAEQSALGNDEVASRLNEASVEMRNREAQRIAQTFRNHWWEIWRPGKRAKPSDPEVITVRL